MRSIPGTRSSPPDGELPVLVGRRRELVDLRQRLTGPDRLLTLTGPGGCGKTSLARAAAAGVERAFADGVWWLDLTDLVHPALLRQSVAQALGVQLRSGDDDPAVLAAALADRQSLLVLDGCDEALDACAELVDRLLRECPRLRVLATGRQPLRVTGESVLVVSPLDLPEAGPLPAPDELMAYPAVELFVERAAAVVPGFRLTEENAAAVVALCADLGGVPLALELAAARMSVLSPQAISERLRDRYRLLTKGAGDAPARQQSLRASVAASYDLCTPEEQALWARLSVFTGSFDLEAVEGVCSGDGLDELDILDLVDALLERSVLSRVDVDAAHVRYRMLESIRAFGAERLDPQQVQRWRDRHLEWYAELAGQAAREWFGPGQSAWCERLRREHTNLRAALEHAVEDATRSAAALRIVPALEQYWVVTGRVGEARHWSERALAQGTGGPAERARALATASWAATLQTDLTAAERLLAEARSLAVPPGDGRTASALLRAEAGLAMWRGRFGPAADLLRRAVDLSRGAGDVAAEATGWFLLGLCAGFAGDPEAASAAHEECLALTAPAGEANLRSAALGLLGLAAFDRGDFAAAAEQARAALELKVGLGDEFATAVLLEALAWVAAGLGQGERAATLLGSADRLWRVLGVSVAGVPWLSERRAAGLELARSALGEREFRSMFRRGVELSWAAAVRYALDDVLDASPEAEEETPLTARESEVAELIGRGMSNREIAGALVISQRTAQGHVENILRKLGFSSRTQVAAWVAERHARTGG